MTQEKQAEIYFSKAFRGTKQFKFTGNYKNNQKIDCCMSLLRELS